MQIHSIHRFLQLCEDENILRSSEKLNISQQGLSRQIHSMEEELGVKLFIRNSRGVSLTPEAQLILPYFKEIWEQYSCACSVLRSRHSQKLIHFGFTFSSTYATGLNFVLNYQLNNNDTSIQIISLSNEACEEQLLNGTLDAALITYPEHSEQFDTILVFESPACAVLNRSHRLATNSTVKLSDLAGETVFLPNQQYRMRQLFDECFPYEKSSFKQIFSSGEHTEYIKLPAATPGVALTFDFLCDNLPSDLVKIPMAEDFPDRIYFCTNKGQPPSPQLRRFIEYVKSNLCAEKAAQQEI